MARQYLIGGLGYVDEQGVNAYLIGGAYFQESVQGGQAASAAGTSAAAGVGAALRPSAATSSGNSSVTGEVPAISSAATSAGSSSASGVPGGSTSSAATSAGSSSATAVSGAPFKVSDISSYLIGSAGYLNETAPREYLLGGVGYVNETQLEGPIAFSAGGSSAVATGGSKTSSAASSAGSSAAEGAGGSKIASAATSAGSSTALGTGHANVRSAFIAYCDQDLFNFIHLDPPYTNPQVEFGEGSSAGSSFATGAGAARFASAASSSGSSSATADGVGIGGVVIPPNAVAFYSVKRPVGYSGKAGVAEKISDPTQFMEVDYRSDDLFVDAEAAEAAFGVGNARMKTWYDTTGNGHHAPQNGTGPLLRSANKMFGLQPISTVSATGNIGITNFSLPASIVISRHSYTMYACFAATGGLFNSCGFMGLGTSATATENVSLLYANDGGRMKWRDDSFRGSSSTKTRVQVGQPMPVVLKCDGSLTTLKYNGVTYTTAAPADSVMTGGYIGKGSWLNGSGVDQAPFSVAEYFAVAICDEANDDAADQEFIGGCREHFAARDDSDFDTIVVQDGDSLTASYNQGCFLMSYPRLTHPLLDRRVGMIDSAVSGVGIQDRINNIASIVAHYDATKKMIYQITIGTNDIAGRASGTIVGYAATIAAKIAEYADMLLALGPNVEVSWAEVVPRSWTGSATDKSQKEAERLDLNNVQMPAIVAARPRMHIRAFAAPWTGNEAAFIAGTSDGIHPLPPINLGFAVIDAALINSQLP